MSSPPVLLQHRRSILGKKENSALPSNCRLEAANRWTANERGKATKDQVQVTTQFFRLVAQLPHPAGQLAEQNKNHLLAPKRTSAH
jgi:hypothetical protein